MRRNDSKFRTQADYDLRYKMFVAIFFKEKNSGALPRGSNEHNQLDKTKQN